MHEIAHAIISRWMSELEDRVDLRVALHSLDGLLTPCSRFHLPGTRGRLGEPSLLEPAQYRSPHSERDVTGRRSGLAVHVQGGAPRERPT